MRRRWHLWVSFTGFLLLLFGAVLALTFAALRFERRELEARLHAAVEEDVRLALWRLDTAAAALIARESAHPVGAHDADMLSEWARTHFEMRPDGSMDFGGSANSEVEAFRLALNREELLLRTESPPLVPVPDELDDAYRKKEKPKQLEADLKESPKYSLRDRVSSSMQMTKNSLELKARSKSVKLNLAMQNAAPPRPKRAVSGPMSVLWVGDRLVLVRRVLQGDAIHLHGAWLDWSRVSAWLLKEVEDLVPSAGFEPVAPDSPADARMMASLPVRLVTAPRAAAADGSRLFGVLGLAWAAVLIAATAVLALLWGTHALSERRAAFVSAVTHELRTPLTTFRLYTEMLADGMVRSDEQRKTYLDTLRTEASRLSHLVENVLTFGRVERGRTVRAPEAMRVDELFARQAERLEQRTVEAKMTLVRELEPGLCAWMDPGAVEQILFNLVDNACKYAAEAQDRRLVVSGRLEGRHVVLRVRDFGPGLSPDARANLFVPFGKSAARAAASAPGVGLGLSLCQSLAKSQGGSLKLEKVDVPGACFALRLRAAERSETSRGAPSG
jgi:signal transduction histidine kinase